MWTAFKRPYSLNLVSFLKSESIPSCLHFQDRGSIFLPVFSRTQDSRNSHQSSEHLQWLIKGVTASGTTAPGCISLGLPDEAWAAQLSTLRFPSQLGVCPQHRSPLWPHEHERGEASMTCPGRPMFSAVSGDQDRHQEDIDKVERLLHNRSLQRNHPVSDGIQNHAFLKIQPILTNSCL